MLKKILLILLVTSSLSSQETIPVAMSNEYSSCTETIRTSLYSFKEWVLDAVESHQDELRQVIDKQGFLVISDVGCFDGGNFFEPLKEVIIKIRKLLGDDFKIKIIYSDLNKNPGVFTKQLLMTPELFGEDIETTYLEHNFYQPLPYQSNITLCTLGTHWLSKAPILDGTQKTLFPTCFEVESFSYAAVTRLAKEDLDTFFQARQKDTDVFLGLVNMIQLKSQEGTISYTAQATMKSMDDIYNQMPLTNRGIIPFFYRFPEEFIDAAKKDGYQIERTGNFIFPCDYVQLYKKKKINKKQLVAAEVSMARAWSEGSVLHLLGNHLIEDFYELLHGHFDLAPEKCGSDYHLQFLILYHDN